ncbi:MAG: Fe-S cluster assembly protein HesB [Planctomycetes bacterium]|nr:Fe-S cluster assembly protein HesB [Planctomycetota bacterium]
MPRRTVPIQVTPPFDLRLCLFGHGWIALAPHRWDEATETLATVLRHGRTVFDAELEQTAPDRLQLRLEGHARPTAATARAAARQIVHMLRLGDDLAPFHALCRREPRLRWAARRGAGRLLRSATVFEDLMKLLFTTNTTWAGTESMTAKLVAAAGSPAPSGARAFPTPRQCRRDAAFYRDVVRAGYRAEAAVELAAAFGDGRLDDATFLQPQPGPVLWQRLVGLRGFGPYAAGQAMRLLGHYEHLALDSWCRARLAELDATARPPRDADVARRYARFAPFQGLALWLDLTADWHSGRDRRWHGTAVAATDRPRT